ncbi:MAG: bifunctional fructose-bisphosphatase/inositol-phosphate phosphatase [ANME-2 cluster archaeon]|nr:bifunctional fructose-bisphosphatase/inositol-phosphate phosphatase [ANME-2 cluster archaeon]
MSEIAVLCDDVAEAVSRAVKDLVGTSRGDRVVGMGADGTPSKLIDIAAEDAALEILASSGIDMKVVSEEKGILTYGERPEFTVVLDPLDGTFNATHNIPFFSVSIAIGNNDLSDIRYAKVFNLASGMDFTASIGEGAQCNGQEIQVSQVSGVQDFTVATYAYHDGWDVLKRMGRHIRRIRTLGSAALELCLVASGGLDAFVDTRNRLRIMDVAAGILIVKEAGGIVTDGQGRGLFGELNVTDRVNVVASNGTVHTELEKTIGL